MNFGNRLKQLRTSKNVSIYNLSQASGVSETHIRDLEGNRKNPSLDTVYRLLDSLGTNLSEFFNENNETVIVTPEEKEFITLFSALAKNKQQTILELLKQLSE